MAGLRSRLRRLSRKSAGNTVSLALVDGSTKTFPAETFWLGLFVAASHAACGVVPEGPVADAVRGATPEERARMEALAETGALGDFLRGSGKEDGLGLLEVADATEDLSEQA